MVRFARHGSLCLLVVACYSLTAAVTARSTVEPRFLLANFSDKYEEPAVNSSLGPVNVTESFDAWTSFPVNASSNRAESENSTLLDLTSPSTSGDDESSTADVASSSTGDSRSTDDYSLGTTRQPEEDQGTTLISGTSVKPMVKRDEGVEDMRERGSNQFAGTSSVTPTNVVGESTATVTMLKFDREDKVQDRIGTEVSSKEASADVAMIEDTKRADNAMNDLDDAEDRYGAVYPYLNHRQFLRERYWPIYRRHPYNNYLRYPIFPGR